MKWEFDSGDSWCVYTWHPAPFCDEEEGSSICIGVDVANWLFTAVQLSGGNKNGSAEGSRFILRYLFVFTHDYNVKYLRVCLHILWKLVWRTLTVKASNLLHSSIFTAMMKFCYSMTCEITWIFWSILLSCDEVATFLDMALWKFINVYWTYD